LETSKYLAQDMELILQPMTADDELREYLIKNNFRINKEVLAKEGEKIYNIMVARFGEAEEYNDAEIYIGKLLREDIYFPEYLKRRINKLKNAIEGIEKAENPDRDKLERLKKLLLETEEEFYES
ncbi:MAG: tRNA (adenine(22)-N(1))-methyltransferase TrmK, partial [Clostridia bacterium]|nr:tRNA (adenine(22)-N(1))-methyltransferase TrmK [Clostridia bacterium]